MSENHLGETNTVSSRLAVETTEKIVKELLVNIEPEHTDESTILCTMSVENHNSELINKDTVQTRLMNNFTEKIIENTETNVKINLKNDGIYTLEENITASRNLNIKSEIYDDENETHMLFPNGEINTVQIDESNDYGHSVVMESFCNEEVIDLDESGTDIFMDELNDDDESVKNNIGSSKHMDEEMTICENYKGVEDNHIINNNNVNFHNINLVLDEKHICEPFTKNEILQSKKEGDIDINLKKDDDIPIQRLKEKNDGKVASIKVENIYDKKEDLKDETEYKIDIKKEKLDLNYFSLQNIFKSEDLLKRTLWINGLPMSVRAVTLRKLFHTFGKVISVKIVTSHPLASLYYGYVVMEEHIHAIKALEALDKTEFNGVVLRIQLIKDFEKKCVSNSRKHFNETKPKSEIKKSPSQPKTCGDSLSEVDKKEAPKQNEKEISKLNNKQEEYERSYKNGTTIEGNKLCREFSSATKASNNKDISDKGDIYEKPENVDTKTERISKKKISSTELPDKTYKETSKEELHRKELERKEYSLQRQWRLLRIEQSRLKRDQIEFLKLQEMQKNIERKDAIRKRKYQEEHYRGTSCNHASWEKNKSYSIKNNIEQIEGNRDPRSGDKFDSKHKRKYSDMDFEKSVTKSNYTEECEKHRRHKRESNHMENSEIDNKEKTIKYRYENHHLRKDHNIHLEQNDLKNKQRRREEIDPAPNLFDKMYTPKAVEYLKRLDYSKTMYRENVHPALSQQKSSFMPNYQIEKHDRPSGHYRYDSNYQHLLDPQILSSRPGSSFHHREHLTRPQEYLRSNGIVVPIPPSPPRWISQTNRNSHSCSEKHHSFDSSVVPLLGNSQWWPKNNFTQKLAETIWAPGTFPDTADIYEHDYH